MVLLKQSTAVTLMLGPFVDATDGVTPETGLTISQADIRLSKNGAAFAQVNDATGATHGENGWYSLPLNTTDTNTLGTLIVAVYESGALPCWREFLVVPANVYDSLVSGSDYLDIEGAALTTAVCQKIAAVVLRRTCANIEASSDGDTVSPQSLYGAVAKLANRFEIAANGDSAVVYKADKATILGTETLRMNSDADPITGFTTD